MSGVWGKLRTEEGKSIVTERIKLDPLVNRRVIFKLHGQAETMDATILSYDNSGYWIKGGSLAAFLGSAGRSQTGNDICYLEFGRIEWFKAAEQEHSK
jgi:hypothetical protein